MRRLFAVLAATAALVTVSATSATAGELCYDVTVDVQGESVVAESGCETLPV